MRRPLCVFCVTILITLIAIAYLPQNLLQILAAFFAVFLFLSLVIKRKQLGYRICVLLAVIVGCCLFSVNHVTKLDALEPFWGKEVTITACTIDIGTSYIEGMANATLLVDSVNGKPVSFSCKADVFPDVRRGDLIKAKVLITPLLNDNQRLSHYGNGVFAQLEYLDHFKFLGTADGIRGFFITAQTKMGKILRKPFTSEIDGVLSAITIGDRNYIADSMLALYRKAGLSHLIVVSGLHLSLLCGFALIRYRSRKRKIAMSILSTVIAILLCGITAGTPSVLRAAFVLLFCIVADLLYETADPFTTLALAGVVLVLPNSYLVCDLSFQLSFLATLGVLFGVHFVKETLPFAKKQGFIYLLCNVLYTNIMITLFATIVTFPILVLWNMNISLWGFLSNLLTFWMVPFILIFGLLGAIVGLLPYCALISELLLTMSGIFVALLNKVVAQVARLPGTQFYFETKYAALVCILIILLGVCGYYLKFKYRYIIPAMLSVLFFGIGIGNYFTKDIIKITMLGTSSYPAVVVSQNDTAMVLFRGGESDIQIIEEYLEKRGIDQLQLLVDLRKDPTTKCRLKATQHLALFHAPLFEEQAFSFGQINGAILNMEDGAVVVLDCGGTTFATTTGSVKLTKPYLVDVLLATASDSGSIEGDIVLCLTKEAEWLQKYPADDLYYGADHATLWMHDGAEYKLLGVQNGD